MRKDTKAHLSDNIEKIYVPPCGDGEAARCCESACLARRFNSASRLRDVNNQLESFSPFRFIFYENRCNLMLRFFVFLLLIVLCSFHGAVSVTCPAMRDAGTLPDGYTGVNYAETLLRTGEYINDYEFYYISGRLPRPMYIEYV